MPRVTAPAALDCFLAELARCGNVRRAAAHAGLSRSGLYKRIARDPTFAARAITLLARFRHTPDRRRIEPADERRFLAELMRGAPVRVAAAATGFRHPSFYARASRDPRFASRMASALAVGRDRRMLASIHAGLRGVDAATEWEPAFLPMPPICAEQALLQLIFHCPDGPFQCARSAGHGHSRPRPTAPLAIHQASILAKIDAIRRWTRFRETGRWLSNDAREHGERRKDGA